MKRKEAKAIAFTSCVIGFVLFFSVVLWYEGVYKVEKTHEEERRIKADSLRVQNRRAEVAKFRKMFPNYIPCSERPPHFHRKKKGV